MKSQFPAQLSGIIVTLSLLLGACGPSHSASIAKSDLRRVTSPDTPANDIKALVDNNNAFAFDLYQSLHARDGNLIYSPYSISLALAMTYAGARGETESEMAKC
jgi:serpin B